MVSPATGGPGEAAVARGPGPLTVVPVRGVVGGGGARVGGGTDGGLSSGAA